MSINISLQVKFRAFFITLYQFHEEWILPLPEVAFVLTPRKMLSFNERGVQLSVTLIQTPK